MGDSAESVICEDSKDGCPSGCNWKEPRILPPEATHIMNCSHGSRLLIPHSQYLQRQLKAKDREIAALKMQLADVRRWIDSRPRSLP